MIEVKMMRLGIHCPVCNRPVRIIKGLLVGHGPSKDGESFMCSGSGTKAPELEKDQYEVGA